MDERVIYKFANGCVLVFELNDGDPEIEFTYPGAVTRVCGPTNLAPLRDWLNTNVKD